MPGFDDVRGITKGSGRASRPLPGVKDRGEPGTVLRSFGRKLAAMTATVVVLAWTGTSSVRAQRVEAQQVEAQQVEAQQYGTQQAAVPAPPVVDPAPSAAHIAKARRLILATGISRSFQIIIPEFMDQIGTTLTQSRPELVHDVDLVLMQLKPEFERQSDEMIDQSARIYATLLSEHDIDAILAFFDSGAGKKYVGAQPLFLNQLVSGMQAWQQKISINMMTRVREEMKKKGHDL